MVDLAGAEGIPNTVSTFLLERWRDEMNRELIASMRFFQILLSMKRRQYTGLF
jgi:hypothetical protein